MMIWQDSRESWDESYGNQIVMIKEQLQDQHKQEKDILQQKVQDLERHVSANADTNKLVDNLEPPD